MPFKNIYAQRDEVKTLVDESPMDENRYSADLVLPPVLVSQQAGDIPTKKASSGTKLLDLSRAERGSFKRTDLTFGSETFITREKGIEIPVFDTEVMENSEVFNLEVEAARDALQLHKLSIEKSVADAVLNTSTFTGTANQQAATAVWTGATAKIFTDVDNAAKKIKAKAGISKGLLTLTMDETVFNAVIRSTEVREDVKYTSDINSEGMKAQVSYLASYLHIKNIIITSAVADSTPEGNETASFSELWNPALSMLSYITPASNSWRGKGLGRQPIWSKFSKDYKVESYLDPAVASTIMRVRSYRGEKIFTNYGVIITGVTS